MAVKFPSLQSLYAACMRVVRRFPLELAFALCGTIAATVNIELNSLQTTAENWCIRTMMAANLGLLLSLSATLFAVNRTYKPVQKAALRVAAVLLAVLFLFLLDPLLRQTDYFRFFLLSAGFHLLVAFVAFAGRRQSANAFWQFNKTLFLRFLAGALYSAVLFAGLSAAIGSMNLLFGFEFEWDTFSILWVWIAGMFQTLFFLAGVPDDLKALEDDKSYPKGLKIFTQYVLIPLATVYVMILLAYEIKILIQWQLPEGKVSNLILGYAVFGMLSLLLVHPVRHLDENKWVKTYSKSFYVLLVPLIVLLVCAVAVRVIDYGVTEPRYYLIVLAAWLSFITAYFLLAKQQNIIIIPFSLCVVTLITVYGPQSAFSVARQSQRNQLIQVFAKNKALGNGLLKPLSKPADSADERRMIDIVDYLVERHGLESMQTLLTANLALVADSLNKLNENASSVQNIGSYVMLNRQKNWVYTQLKITKKANLYTENTFTRHIRAENYKLVPTANSMYAVDVRAANYADSVQAFVGKQPLLIRIQNKTGNISIRFKGSVTTINTDSLLAAAEKEVIRLYPKNTNRNTGQDPSVDPVMLDRKYLSHQFSVGEFTARLLWNEISYQKSGDDLTLNYANGVLLLR